MNVTESNKLNKLLNWLLKLDKHGYGFPTAAEAMKAAEHLAEKARKTLMAGIDAEKVRARWPALVDEIFGTKKQKRSRQLRR